MDKQGQKERVLEYIEQYGSITQYEADTIAVRRLASRVNDLRKEGHPIISIREEGLNKFGEGCHWARYRMGVRA